MRLLPTYNNSPSLSYNKDGPAYTHRPMRYNAPVPILPSDLAYAVQDLYDLFQRHNPLGGFRHSLFHDSPSPTGALPAAIAEDYRLAWHLARGVSCLLASDLPEAALALTAALWQQVLRQEHTLACPGWREPEYYHYLSRELAIPLGEGAARQQAYSMFGEVLAVQLDLAAQWQGGATGVALRQRVAQLRRELHR